MSALELVPLMRLDARVTTALLVAARVAALVAVAPGFSLRIIPLRMRVVLTFLLTVAAAGSLTDTAAVDASSFPELVIQQAIVGASLGLVPAVMIWGLQVATSTSQGLTGLAGFGAQESGSEDVLSGSASERLLVMTTLAVFFSAGGHRQLVQAVLMSFRWLGPGEHVPLALTRELVIGLLSQSFAMGVRAMSPVIASLIISLLTLAVVNRILPQVGYFAAGMSIQVLVLLASMLLFLGGIGWMWDVELLPATEQLRIAWQQLTQNE